MAKVNISIPDGMLDEIERRASLSGTTRSGFIQEAAAHYLTALEQEEARRERADVIGRAMEDARTVAKEIGPVDGTAIIRQFRDAPPRWLEKDTG